MILAACSPAATEAPTEAPPVETEAPPVETEAPPEETEEPEAVLKVCQVTDVGGIDDKTFNATAWKGVQDAEAEFGVEGKFLESQQQTDYAVNINAFIEEGGNTALRGRVRPTSMAVKPYLPRMRSIALLSASSISVQGSSILSCL
ncbi:MAG: BMP family ABC transporter substrate-binding protein, partial [Anaerolineales bacterium]|nr:BMP family ABC transporter substrate-binding protein [Anaerolineales bacterium]